MCNNIVTLPTAQILNAFIKKISFIDSLKIKTANIMPSLNDASRCDMPTPLFLLMIILASATNFRVQSTYDFDFIFKLLFSSVDLIINIFLILVKFLTYYF